jgi:hypothetical protein
VSGNNSLSSMFSSFKKPEQAPADGIFAGAT